MQNLVVCLDGTWNTPDQMDRGRQVPSNVVKMARAVKGGKTERGYQKVHYDTGVGTNGFRDKIVGGATGQGITKNIMDAYRWLLENVESSEDRIFLFGFSRGAYTARSLAGLIGLCGLPLPKTDGGEGTEAVEAIAAEAKSIYRTKNRKLRDELAAKFRTKRKVSFDTVHFVGVWDTVGALGVPIGFFKRLLAGVTEFHDVTLGNHIQHACHAVAINERRGPFKPALWQANDRAEDQSLIQAWFPGVHSNVGGGYVDSGLSDRALLWMLRHAESRGLVPDKTYIERRIEPNWFGELRDSVGKKYKLLFWNPPAYRAIGATSANEVLHRSVDGRWSHESAPEEEPENVQAAKACTPAVEEVAFLKGE